MTVGEKKNTVPESRIIGTLTVSEYLVAGDYSCCPKVVLPHEVMLSEMVVVVVTQ